MGSEGKGHRGVGGKTFQRRLHQFVQRLEQLLGGNVRKISLQGEIQIITFSANRDRWSHDALLFVPRHGSNDIVHRFSPNPCNSWLPGFIQQLLIPITRLSCSTLRGITGNHGRIY
jgi:hypothetical protein